MRFRGRGLQQVFGSLAEAPPRVEGKVEASAADDQQPEEDAMAAEERILISEVRHRSITLHEQQADCTTSTSLDPCRLHCNQ